MHRNYALWAVNALALVVLSACAALAGPTPSREVVDSSQVLHPTFTKDIAPVVFAQCSSCHRPGEVAPFPLLTYRDVQKRARQVALITEQRVMPPWKPTPGYGEFQHERRLTDAQIALFRRWADAGTPEGRLADLPPAPRFTGGWQLGKPDMVLSMLRPVTIPADGQDVNRSYVIPVHMPKGRYLRAAEFRAGNRRVVHHGTAMLDTSGKALALEAQQGGPGAGYVSFGGPGFIPSGGLPGYAPGMGAETFPADASGVLPKDVDVVLGMHYHPDGKVETDQSSIGLYFTDTPPVRVGSLVTMGALNLLIEPGEKAHLEQDTYKLPVDVDVEAIYEHMHLLGKTCKMWATLPDGTTRPLIQIADWDFSWQATYHLKQRLHLPRGTVLHAEWTHDNTADNPHQFNNPPKRVTNGENSTNEMGGALINVYVANQRDNGILWIANLGHLWKVSVTPPARPAPAKKTVSLGSLLVAGGINGITDFLISLDRSPGGTIGGGLAGGTALCLVCLLTPARFFPRPTKRAAEALSASPWRCFGTGLLVLLALTFLARPLLFSQSPALQALAAVLWAGALAALLTGSGGLARRASRRFFRQAGPEPPPAILAKSSLLLTLLFFLPVAGWLLAPVALVASLGAGLMTLRMPRRTPPAPKSGGARRKSSAPSLLPQNWGRGGLLPALLAFLCLLAVGSRAGAGNDPLANTAGKKAVVLLFIARDCPISNSYAPEIKRIIARYTPQKVAFTLVYPDPDTSLAAARQHAKDYGYTCSLLLDPAHKLVRRAGVTVTPEAAVFAPSGKLLYRGRVDDLYLGFGQRRYAATRHDLRDALDAILSGRPVPSAKTQAVGCFI